MKRRVLLTASLLLLGTGPLVAQTRTKPPRPPLAAAAPKPGISAETVLNKFTTATGGRAAYERIKTSVTKGTLQVAGQNLSGTMEVYTKEPGKILMVSNIQGVGETRVGFNGEVGWSKDPLTGLRTLQTTELVGLKQQAAATDPGNWKKLYKKIEMLGLRKVDGRDAYAVRLTPKAGKHPTVQYFDTKTFLLVRMDMISEGPQGVMPTESYLSDYRVVNGVKTPFALRQRLGGVVEMVITMNEVKYNAPVEDALFAKPAAEAPAKK